MQHQDPRILAQIDDAEALVEDLLGDLKRAYLCSDAHAALESQEPSQGRSDVFRQVRDLPAISLKAWIGIRTSLLFGHGLRHSGRLVGLGHGFARMSTTGIQTLMAERPRLDQAK